MDLHRGRTEGARTHAELAVERALKSDDEALADHALLNLIAVLHTTGELEASRDVAELLAARTTSHILRSIAQGVLAILAGSVDANLEEIRERLQAMAVDQERGGLRHYVGITWLNVADIDCARGDAEAALAASNRAIHELTTTSASIEVEAARALRGWALALLGSWGEADAEFTLAESGQFDAVRAETLTFISEAYALFGDRQAGEAVLSRAREARFVSDSVADHQRLASALFAIRRGEHSKAQSEIDAIQINRPHEIEAFQARVRLAEARLALGTGTPDAGRRTAAALHLAVRQGAKLYAGGARVLQAALADQASFATTIRQVAGDMPACLSTVAEVVTERLGLLEPEIFATVAAESRRLPIRWREPLRRAVAVDVPNVRLPAAVILDEIGETSDILPLRAVARSLRGREGAANLGRGLARRLAPRILVEDQGRVQITVGGSTIPGTSVRRKVLALLCYLLTKPSLAATRDQVLDALWPDLEPDVAVNSLNQTVYFLRRVFEPAFSDDTSPGYIHHDSDVLWLDPELVDSRSIRAREAIRSAERDPTPENVDRVSRTYSGRFALDFAYEDWAGPYRDSLHAAYLEIIERAVTADTNAGSFDRAIGLARRALEADPEAEQVELSLLRLYRRTGAHAAAAEQYAHYAAVLRNELGIEPPPLESL
jgi:DNA-binding SARP family transcriptional activator